MLSFLTHQPRKIIRKRHFACWKWANLS